MWDVNDGSSQLWTSNVHTHGVNCVALSPNGRQVVTGSNDHTILVLSARNGEVLFGPFRGHTSSVCSVSFSIDGTYIVSGSGDRTVRVWNVESGTQVINSGAGHTEIVTSVAFMPDGARVISGSADGTIRFWDISAASELATVSPPCMHGEPNGWLTDAKSQLLLWMPSDLRMWFQLPSPFNPIIITGNYSTSIDGSMLWLGDQWHKCYEPSLTPAP